MLGSLAEIHVPRIGIYENEDRGVKDYPR